MQRVLVLGATSAVASEAAVLYAARGDRLWLVGRNADKLAALEQRCRATPVTTQRADFTELERAAAVIDAAFEGMGGVDVVLIAHGDLGDQLASEQSFSVAEQSLRTNLLSVIALLVPLANRLEAQKSGRIGVITSVAAERGRPRNYTYAAAKGALNVYLQGMRSRLYPAGVTVTTLKMGPVDSPMTHDHAKHALFGKPAGVAQSIVRAIDAGVPEAYVPSFWRAIMPIVKGTPEALFQRIPFLSGR
jgi:short-subunit dehydrogenase